jgi:lysophospholipase L1-like esterase
MKHLALLLSLIALHSFAADKPVETDPRLHSDGKGWKFNQATIIWASSTPVLVEGEVKKLDPVINANTHEQNRMAAKVMAETNVLVSDFYALLADKLERARGGKDKFHWNAPAYQFLGEACAQSVSKALPNAK